MDTDAKTASPELKDGLPDQNSETFDSCLPMPDWHREELLVRLTEYRAGRAGRGRDWSEVRIDLKAKLAQVRQPPDLCIKV